MDLRAANTELAQALSTLCAGNVYLPVPIAQQLLHVLTLNDLRLTGHGSSCCESLQSIHLRVTHTHLHMMATAPNVHTYIRPYLGSITGL